MNNVIFNPFREFNNPEVFNIEKLINKVERLEKNIRILENRVNIIEKKEIKVDQPEEPSDMYMI